MFEDISALHFIVLTMAGFFAGFVNVFAGGGSLITLPILMDVIGLPAAIANGTNRFAIIALNTSAIAGFQSKGYKITKYTISLGVIALIFAIIGAKLSIGISNNLFKKILAIVMIFAIFSTIVKPMLVNKTGDEKLGNKQKFYGMLAFAGVGFYGGLIQAGVGFVIITVLSLIHNMKLPRINSIKVVVVCIYSLAAIAVFIFEGKFMFIYGLILAIGGVFGAFIGARLNTTIDEKYIKIVLIIVLAIMAVKIFLFDN